MALPVVFAIFSRNNACVVRVMVVRICLLRKVDNRFSENDEIHQQFILIT